VTVPSRGGVAHSIASISLDDLHIRELPIVGGIQPNSGENIIAAFRNESKESIVGWLDPVTNTPVVAVPKIVIYFPVLLVPIFVVLLFLLLAVPSHKDVFFYLLVSVAFAFTIVQGIGWPGVARQLRKAQAQNQNRYL
jgi:hypothetical protein